MKLSDNISPIPEQPTIRDVEDLLRKSGKSEEFIEGLVSRYNKVLQENPTLAAQLLNDIIELSIEMWNILRSKEVIEGMSLRIERIARESRTEIDKLIKQKDAAKQSMTGKEYDRFCDEIREKIDKVIGRQNTLIGLELDLLK